MEQTTKKILAIDDNEDNLLTLKALIFDLFNNYQVFTATSGIEGIELAKIHNPDLILLDILMPQMDGFATCKLLKEDEKLRDIPVIFVTALKESRENKVKAIEVGAEGFLTKPVDENELSAHIKAFLQISRKVTSAFSHSELMQSIVENAISTINIDSCALYLIYEKETISLVSTIPPLPDRFPEKFKNALLKDHPHIEQTILNNRCHIIEDTRTATLSKAEEDIVRLLNFRTILYQPIFLRENVIGVLILGSIHKSHSFTEEEFHLLSGFSHQLAQVYDNAGNYEQVKMYAKELESEITERIQAERNFKHSIDDSPLGIRIVNQDGLTVYANQAFLDIYEFSSVDEFMQTKAQSRYTEQSYIEHLERKRIRRAGGDVSSYEISILRKNGEVRHIKFLLKEVIWNKENHFQFINQDITE